MQDFGGNLSFTPSLLHHFTPLGRLKSCKGGGLICLLAPHSYTILPPLDAQSSPKRCKSFELHFPKKSSHCRPTLTSFYPPWQPDSYIILTPLNKLPPHSCTILPPLAANSYIIKPPLNKLPPHSYTILPPWQLKS